MKSLHSCLLSDKFQPTMATFISSEFYFIVLSGEGGMSTTESSDVISYLKDTLGTKVADVKVGRQSVAFNAPRWAQIRNKKSYCLIIMHQKLLCDAVFYCAWLAIPIHSCRVCYLWVDPRSGE